jgi:micrococcal nuclease
LGIDTPESRTRDREEKARGLLSKQFLKDLLTDKDFVIKTYKKNAKGKFGRVLGEIWIEEKNVNKEMIELGYAVEYYGQSKEAVKEAHQKNKQLLIERGLYEEKKST